MQVLCGLQVVFFLFNCQTPEIVEAVTDNDLQTRLSAFAESWN